MIETKIYIGLNDSKSMKQMFDTSTYIHILKGVCTNYAVPFSFSVVEGGYMHENGEYTQETTLVISLIDVEKTSIDEIARDLCAFFHQESVMITEDHVRAYFIKESLQEEKNTMEKLNDDELSQVFGGAIADKFDGIQEDSDDDDLNKKEEP